MTIFIISFVVMAVIMAGMAVGVIFGGKAIKGSCGGANNGSCVCTEKCDKRKKLEAAGEAG